MQRKGQQDAISTLRAAITTEYYVLPSRSSIWRVLATSSGVVTACVMGVGMWVQRVSGNAWRCDKGGRRVAYRGETARERPQQGHLPCWEVPDGNLRQEAYDSCQSKSIDAYIAGVTSNDEPLASLQQNSFLPPTVGTG